MVTTVTREIDPNTAVATPVVEPAAVAAVDISRVPETPAELLKQWDTPKRSVLHIIPATLGRIWDALVGPGMSDLERLNRDIAEHNGYARALGRVE